MVKNITVTKRMVLEWLISRGYRREDIVFNRRSSPDFILPDGRRIEVKRVAGNAVYFTRKQWECLDDGVEIALVNEGLKEPIAVVPFSEVRRVAESGGRLLGRFRVIIQPSSSRVICIRCGEDLYKAFVKFSLDYDGYSEALRELMVRAGVLKKPITF
ncbi:MAG: hypothetical protein QXZ56_07605 [Sulfolobales archaeon]